MLPKIVLVGYPGSQRIIKASRYLTNKYLPDFNITYLNYTGEINGWGDYVAGFLEYLTDDEVVFALDDYLVAAKIDMIEFAAAERLLKNDVVCVKLCESTPEEHEAYPITTQYTIWNKKYLMDLLRVCQNPWNFEINGSMLHNGIGKKSVHHPCMKYFANSAISNRWEGVCLKGLNEEDIQFLKVNNYVE